MAPFKAGGRDDADEVIARIEADAVPAAGGMRGGASDAC
jgi:hypothetical protein